MTIKFLTYSKDRNQATAHHTDGRRQSISIGTYTAVVAEAMDNVAISTADGDPVVSDRGELVPINEDFGSFVLNLINELEGKLEQPQTGIKVPFNAEALARANAVKTAVDKTSEQKQRPINIEHSIFLEPEPLHPKWMAKRLVYPHRKRRGTKRY